MDFAYNITREFSDVVDSSLESSPGAPMKHFKVTTANCRYQVVKECLYKAGLTEVDLEDPWDLLWMDCGISLERALSLKVIYIIQIFSYLIKSHFK